MVEEFLEGLLSSSRSLYVAAVAADRIPEQGPGSLSAWWGIEVQSISTTRTHMSFVVSKTRAKFNFSWANVPGIASTGSQPMAPSVLEAFLYYTKNLVNF